MTKTTHLATVALGLFLVATTASAGSRLEYPADLNDAVARAYPNLRLIGRTCEVSSDQGRSLEAVAAVMLRGGRHDLAGFQFINTAGWFNMWRQGAPTPAVPESRRAIVTGDIRRLKVACAKPWR